MPSTEDLEEPVAPPPAQPAWYRVTAPGPVSGGIYGVGFANGQAIVEDEGHHAVALAWFRSEPGYRVESLDPPAPAPDDPPAEPIPHPAPAEDQPAEDSPPAATTRQRK
jgi:hypothetical protein